MTARTEDLKALARRQPVENLALALTALNAGTQERDEAARLTHAVIIDIIIEKSPAAAAVFHALAESDLENDEIDAMMIAVALGAEAAAMTAANRKIATKTTGKEAPEEVADVYFAVPDAYTPGKRFETWDLAVKHALSTITRSEYPGQTVSSDGGYFHPRRYFQEGNTLVIYSRAFVDIRTTSPTGGDHPLLRWEIFRDGTAEADAGFRPWPAPAAHDEVPGEELTETLARLVHDPDTAAGAVPGDRHGTYGVIPTWTARAIETAFAEAGWRVVREPGHQS